MYHKGIYLDLVKMSKKYIPNYAGGLKMKNNIVEYGKTLQIIGGGLVQASKDLSITTDEDSEVILVKLEREVLLLERSATTLETVTPPKVIEKEHLELIGVFKDLAEGKKYLIQYIKSNGGSIACEKFSKMLKDTNNKGKNIKNISNLMVIRLLNSLIEKDV